MTIKGIINLNNLNEDITFLINSIFFTFQGTSTPIDSSFSN